MRACSLRIAGRVLVILALAFPMRAGAIDATSLADTVREAKVREAALRSIEGSIDTLRARLSDADALAAAMLNEPEKFTNLDRARELLEQQERMQLADEFAKQLEGFAEGRSDLLPEDWVARVIDEEGGRVSATLDRLLEEEFPARFSTAREHAVARQTEALEPRLLPSADEVEELIGEVAVIATLPSEEVKNLSNSPEWRMWQQSRLAEIRQDTAVLQEIDRELPGRVAERARQAVAGLWRQLRMLDRYEPAGAVRREDIARSLREDLETLARSSRLPYGVFPSANTQIDERAEELERASWLEYIGSQLSQENACPALPAAAVHEAAGATAGDMPAGFAEHSAAISDQLRAPAEAELIQRYAQQAPEGAARLEFAKRLTDALENDEAIERRVRAGFEACLEAPLREHRMEVAHGELASKQPAIADLSFELSDDDLIGLIAKGDEIDPTVFPTAGNLHLEESRALHAERVAELQREALDVMRAQELLTRARTRKREFVRLIKEEGQREKHSKEHYQNEYEKSVEEAWEQRRGRVLLRDDKGAPLHEGKYARVLPTTSQIIDEIITLEFERPAPTATKPRPTRTQIPSRPPTPLPTKTPPRTRTRRPRTPQPRVSGPTDRVEQAGLPLPIPQRIPQSNSGGAPAKGPDKASGGKKDCPQAMRDCQRASQFCYAALLECRDNRASCEASLARCGQMKFECEQTK